MPEDLCDAVHPFRNVACVLPAGHDGKHRAPNPELEITRAEVDAAIERAAKAGKQWAAYCDTHKRAHDSLAGCPLCRLVSDRAG